MKPRIRRGAALMRQYKADDAKREKARERVLKAANQWFDGFYSNVIDDAAALREIKRYAVPDLVNLATAIAVLRKLEAKKR